MKNMIHTLRKRKKINFNPKPTDATSPTPSLYLSPTNSLSKKHTQKTSNLSFLLNTNRSQNAYLSNFN